MKMKQLGFSKNKILGLTMAATIPFALIGSIPLSLQTFDEANSSNNTIEVEQACDKASSDNKQPIGGGRPASTRGNRNLIEMLFLPYKS